MKKILWLLVAAMVFAVCVTPLSAAQKFTDVKDNDWFAGYVYDLTGQGILNGKGDGKFAPGDNVTRGEFAKILAFASKEDLSQYQGKMPFTDCTNHWSKNNIAWAYEKGIVKGTSETTFDPDANITRQQMAVMIYRYADDMDLTLPREVQRAAFKDEGKIAAWAKDAVAAMQQANIINGYPEGTFLPENNATRAEASKIISVFLTKAKDKEVNDETYQEFMDKEVNDFEADRVLNFDESTEDNFAVVKDDVELVKDNNQTNDLTAANEETGTYVFTNMIMRTASLWSWIIFPSTDRRPPSPPKAVNSRISSIISSWMRKSPCPGNISTLRRFPRGSRWKTTRPAAYLLPM